AATMVVGADVHKHTHTFVAVDAVGRQLGQRTVEATTQGHLKALRWARGQFGEDLTWAVEDCRHLSARLERDLLSAGQPVVRVPPKMMAEQRRVARTRGKSDPIDALAVARAFLREPTLPVASHDEVSREAKLLVDRRETLVNTRTRTINSLLWRVHELDPAHAPKARSLHLGIHQQALKTWLVTLEGVVAEMARDELEDIIALTARIKGFDKRISALVRREVPTLLTLTGCGELSAAKLFGETAGIGRVRMTRSGNRQLNAALHRIAITQARMPGTLAKTYYEKKLAEGKSPTEALRCLKRRLARTTYNLLTTDHPNHQTPAHPAAA
ncbi:transposase, partial [Micrococcus sp.]|uniref:transposase n=1 Tax=Micrococcus sp. TaxID=1271 RepID=UPI0026DC405B